MSDEVWEAAQASEIQTNLAILVSVSITIFCSYALLSCWYISHNIAGHALLKPHELAEMKRKEKERIDNLSKLFKKATAIKPNVEKPSVQDGEQNPGVKNPGEPSAEDVDYKEHEAMNIDVL